MREPHSPAFLHRIRLLSAGLLLSLAALSHCKRMDPTPDPPREGSPPSPIPSAPLAVPPEVPSQAPQEPLAPTPSALAKDVQTTGALPLSFAPLTKRADPAVATVKARMQRETPTGRRRTVAEGLGTAFVYDPNGYLLTNNHVIEDANDISVGFVDGREFKAEVVGKDKQTDVAIIRVESKGLPSLPLGDSDGLEVGDWVLAIGNPFGLSHTVSAGILSAKGRSGEDVKGLDPTGYFSFLQTDASINPGNSGGPLLNMRGEVVGINAAVRANANNIGFAIPINMVRELMPILLTQGTVRRSWIGVTVDYLSTVEAGRLGRADRKGAWVKGVVRGAPAERAGIEPDDVIVAFEGRPVDPNELRWRVSIAGVGKSVSLRVVRQEKQFDVKVVLAALPEFREAPDEFFPR